MCSSDLDRVGGCGAQWSAAVRAGASDGPITAMARCGDGAAVRYAQHLDGTNVWTGLVLVAAALLFGWFMVSAGASVFMASLRALYTTVKLVPSLLAGAISGAPQRHAQTVVWQFFKHGLEVTVFIVFVSVIGLAIERLIAAPLPAELGGANPFAHVVMMGAASVAALYLLRHIRADLAGRPAGPGLLVRGGQLVGGLAMSAAVGGVSSAAVGGARGLRNKLGSQGQAPWELADEIADKTPQEVLGEPLDGFDPVASGADTVSTGPGGEDGTPGAPGWGAAGSRDGAPGVDPVGGEGQAAGSASAREAPAFPGDGGLEGGGQVFGTAVGHSEAVAVDPIAEAASTGVGEDIPLPQEPPADDEEPPPPGEAGPAATTVDPITGSS